MNPRYFLRLGGGKTRRYPLSLKAVLLDQAVQAGLPVPAGIVLLDEGWRYLQADGSVMVDGDSVHVTGADILLQTFALRALPRPVALRPVFVAADRSETDPTDRFPVRLNVPHTDAHALIYALVEVWQAAKGQSDTLRRDILVMDMVTAQQAGTALLSKDGQDDIIHLVPQAGEQPAPETLRLLKLTGGQRPTADAPHLRRLQQLLRGVRRTLTRPGGDWVVEWVDDGDICWLWEIRPNLSPRRAASPHTPDTNAQ